MVRLTISKKAENNFQTKNIWIIENVQSKVFLPVLNYKDFVFFKENMKGVLCNTEEVINIGVKLAKEMWNNLNIQLKPKSFRKLKTKMGTRLQKLIKLEKIKINFILSL